MGRRRRMTRWWRAPADGHHTGAGGPGSEKGDRRWTRTRDGGSWRSSTRCRSRVDGRFRWIGGSRAGAWSAVTSSRHVGRSRRRATWTSAGTRCRCGGNRRAGEPRAGRLRLTWAGTRGAGSSAGTAEPGARLESPRVPQSRPGGSDGARGKGHRERACFHLPGAVGRRTDHSVVPATVPARRFPVGVRHPPSGPAAGHLPAPPPCSGGTGAGEARDPI